MIGHFKPSRNPKSREDPFLLIGGTNSSKRFRILMLVLSFSGKMLGGSSGLNLMVHQRASQEEYDAWADIGAGDGWDWEGLLPFFKLSESVTASSIKIDANASIFPGSDSNFEGRNGPLKVGYNNFHSDTEAPFVNTMTQLGFPYNSDPVW